MLRSLKQGTSGNTGDYGLRISPLCLLQPRCLGSPLNTSRRCQARWGRPNSRATRGHLKESLAGTRVQAGASVLLSRNSSHNSRVSRPSFATQKTPRIKGMRPSRRSPNCCDIRLSGRLRRLQSPKWPLVARLLGLGHVAMRSPRRSGAAWAAAAVTSVRRCRRSPSRRRCRRSRHRPGADCRQLSRGSR
jgi:hypothetical protein